MGDVIHLETGNKNIYISGEILPVDGIVFKASNLSVNESSITGENDDVKKGVP